MIYFIQCNGHSGPIKIGLSNVRSIDKRLTSLRSHNPYSLRLLGTIPGGYHKERAMHERFKMHRIRGEWYKPAPTLLKFIGSLRDEDRPRVRETVITERQWEMVKLHAKGFTQTAIARKLGITRQAVHHVLGAKRLRVIRRWHGHLFENRPTDTDPALAQVMTIAELSEVTGISGQCLSRAARKGTLDARKSGSTWLSTPAAVERAIESGRLRRKE